MQINAATPEEYISKLPDERKEIISGLRRAILDHLSDGFEETISYGMIGYVIPHRLYPAGYHVNPGLPLPYMNLASQKNHIAVYHSGIYMKEQLQDWLVGEYVKLKKRKPDMGKSCIRFRNSAGIPIDLIGELAGKMTVEEFINLYESGIRK